MGKEILLSNIGFFLGIGGSVIAVIPFFNSNNPQIYTLILPAVMGIVGLMITLKVKKELNDDLVKAGLVVNPLAIFLAIVQMVIFFIR